MPKIFAYPLDPIQDCLNIAKIVYKNNGHCSKEDCATKAGKPLSGQFQSLISSSVKYKLLENKKGQLHTTPQYTDIELAYDTNEQHTALKAILMDIPIYNKLISGQEKIKPEDYFKKKLIKEFQVDIKRVNQVYNTIRTNLNFLNISFKDTTTSPTTAPLEEQTKSAEGHYTVHISGSGINSKIQIDSHADIPIIQTLLQKIERNL